MYLPSHEAFFETAREGQDAAADALAVAEAASPDAVRVLSVIAESARTERILAQEIKVKRDKVASLARAMPAAQMLAVASENAASSVTSGNISAHGHAARRERKSGKPALAAPSEFSQLLKIVVTSESSVYVSLSLDAYRARQPNLDPSHAPPTDAMGAGASDAMIAGGSQTCAPGRGTASRSRKPAVANTSMASRLQMQRAALAAMEADLEQARVQHQEATAEARAPLLRPSMESIQRCRAALDRAKVQVQRCKQVVFAVANVLREARPARAHRQGGKAEPGRYSEVNPVARARTAVVRCCDVESQVRCRSPVCGYGHRQCGFGV